MLSGAVDWKLLVIASETSNVEYECVWTAVSNLVKRLKDLAHHNQARDNETRASVMYIMQISIACKTANYTCYNFNHTV